MKTIILFGLVFGALSAAGKVYIATVGEKIILECGVSNFQRRLEWIQKDLILRVAGKNSLPSKGKSSISQRVKKVRETDLEISNVQKSDFGTFTCAVDSVRHQHHLIVVSLSVPSGTLEVGTEATLVCDASGGVPGEPPPTVLWQKANYSVQGPTLQIKSVAVSHKGIWLCKVSYQGVTETKTVTIDVNEPDPVTTNPKLQPPSKSSNSGNGKNSTGGVGNQPLHLLGLAWWIWAAIGAGGLLVIILIIVIIVMYKRNKRRKKKFLRMKKTQLSQKPKKYCQCVRETAAEKPRQGRRREKPSALPLQPLLQE